MKHLSLSKSNSGASIIYVVIAAAILGLTITMVTKSTGTMFKARKQATARTAYQAIDGAMESQFSKYMKEYLKRSSTKLVSEEINIGEGAKMKFSQSNNIFGKVPRSSKGVLRKLNDSLAVCRRPCVGIGCSTMQFCMEINTSGDDSENRSSLDFADKIFVEYKATLIRATDLRPINFGLFDSNPSSIVRVESTLYWRYKNKDNKSQIQNYKSQFYIMPDLE